MNNPTEPQDQEKLYSRIIKQLEKSDEPLTLNELAMRTSISMSYLWILNNELVKLGRVVIRRFPREGSTLHGYLPKYVFRYTVPGKQESAPKLFLALGKARSEGYDEGYQKGVDEGIRQAQAMLREVMKKYHILVDTEDKQ